MPVPQIGKKGSWNPAKYVWKYKPPTVDSQIPPVTDTYYTILNLTGGVRLKQLVVFQKNDEAADKAIEVLITIDGETITNTMLLGNNKYFGISVDEKGDLTADVLAAWDSILTNFRGFLDDAALTSSFVDHEEADAVKIQYKNIDAAGTNQQLKAYVRYSQKEAV